MSQPTSQKPYYRDSFTWLAYFMLAYYGYMQAVPGPAMPLLRDELRLSHGIAGLHFSVFAIGMIFAGITSTALIRRFGRRFMFWVGGGGMALGAILMVFGRIAPMTIGGMFLMGWLGTYVLNLVPATLSDHHGDNRATAVTEANVAASATIAFVPLFVGFFATTALGWRTAFWIPIIIWAVILSRTYKHPMPAPITHQDGTTKKVPLPRRFWLILLIIFLVVAAEWSMAAWAADFMVHDVGLAPALASGVMSLYYLPMVIGRFVGSRLTRRANAFAILPGALILSMIGFLIFWLAPFPVLNVIGLFVTGLGVANLYPLSLAVATITAEDQTDRASALISVPIGTSILVAPLILGIVADGFGIRIALGQMLILFIAAMVVYWFARQQKTEKHHA